MTQIIDFNDIKNKAREKDVDELENYVYGLYYEVAEGKLTLAQLNEKIKEYVKVNNIPNEKFIDMQKKLIERYGYNPDDIEKQMKSMQDPYINGATITSNLKNKYGDSLNAEFAIKKHIKNDTNDVYVISFEEEVYLVSSKHIVAQDNELNEYLISYKKQIGDKTLKVRLSESMTEFDY